MDPHPDAMQKAADEAGGYEGKLLKHNCKTSEVLLDGVAIGAIHVVFLMDEATHGWVEFSEAQKLIFSDIRRFAVVAPDRNEQVPESYKPNTGCLCIVKDTGQLATYQGASWSARSAFMKQLFKPYVRARKAGILPVVTLSFKEEQRDDNGNYLPDFEIVDWVKRSRYAMILGEVEQAADAALAAPTAAAAPAAPLPKPKPLQIVTSGRPTAAADTPKPEAPKAPDQAPANDEGAVDYPDDYGGPRGPIDDDIPF
jgi:hypothetical protein